MAEPSIAMIPSGYKAEKIYSVLPTNGNADLDFARNSKATRINEQGLIEEMAVNVPLLDYSDGTCPSLLLQPQSTNLIQYSEEATNWQTDSSSVLATSNQEISPDGTLNADKLIPANGSVISNGGRYIGFSSTAGTNYSVSVFVKQGEYRYVTFSYGSNSAYGFHFDLQDGVIIQELINPQYTSISREVKSFGNGWYRLKISLLDNSTSGRFISVRPANELPTATNNNYATTGDGVSGVYVWGFQLESNASYATSYIKTEGSTQTRLQDTASKSGISSLINSSEGVFYAEISALYDNSVNDLRWFSLNDNSTNNLVTIYYYKATNTIGAQLKVGGVQVFRNDDIPITSKTDFIKIAFKWKQDDVAIYINGIKKASSTSVNSFNSGVLNRFSFDRGVGGQDFYGKTKNLQVYKTALTDAQLTTLTTI